MFEKSVWRETIFIDFIVGCAGAVCAVLYDADSTASRYTRAKHQRDKLRSKSYHLRDVNRNLQLEYGALFDSDKMQVLSERLGMVEPSLADGNLFYWKKNHESAAVYAAAKMRLSNWRLAVFFAFCRLSL